MGNIYLRIRKFPSQKIANNFFHIIILTILWFDRIPQIKSYCKAPGCELFFNSNSVKSNVCGRSSICRWNLRYYLQNQPGVVIPTDSQIPTVDVLGADIIKYMNFVGYPEVPFPMEECITAENECIKWLDILLPLECLRVLPELSKPTLGGPKGRQPTFLKPFKVKELGIHLWIKNGTFKTPNYNGKNYYPQTCPAIRRTWTILVLLRHNKIEYEENMMIAELGTLLDPDVLHNMWCDIVEYEMLRLYDKYSSDKWCLDWKLWEVFVCVNYNNPPQPPDFDKVLSLCQIARETLPQGIEAMVVID